MYNHRKGMQPPLLFQIGHFKFASALLLIGMFLFCGKTAFSKNTHFLDEHTLWESTIHGEPPSPKGFSSVQLLFDPDQNQITAEIELTVINHTDEPRDSLFFQLWGNTRKSHSTDFAKQQLLLGKTEHHFHKTSSERNYEELDFSHLNRKLQIYHPDEKTDLLTVLLKESWYPDDTLSLTIFLKFKTDKQSLENPLKSWHWLPLLTNSSKLLPPSRLKGQRGNAIFQDFSVTVLHPRDYKVLSNENSAVHIQNSNGEFPIGSKNIIHSEENWVISKFWAENVRNLPLLFVPQSLPKSNRSFTGEKNNILLEIHGHHPTLSHDLIFQKWEMILENYDSRGYQFPWNKCKLFFTENGPNNTYQTDAGLLSISKNTPDSCIDMVIGKSMAQMITSESVGWEMGTSSGTLATLQNLVYRNQHPDCHFSTGEKSGVEKIINYLWPSESETHPFRRKVMLGDLNSSGDIKTMNHTDLESHLNWVPDKLAKMVIDLQGMGKTDRILSSFLINFQFQNTSESMLSKHWEGDEDLSWGWFFEIAGGQFSPPLQVQIVESRIFRKFAVITLENKSEITHPIPLNLLLVDGSEKTIWLDGFTGKQRFRIEEEALRKVDMGREVPFFPEEKKKLNLKTTELVLPTQPSSEGSNNLFILPAWPFNNIYDGIQPGLLFHNLDGTVKSHRFFLQGAVGLNSGKPTFGGEYRFTRALNNWYFDRIETGLKTSHYGFSENDQFGFTNRFYKLRPYLRLEWADRNPFRRFEHSVELNWTGIWENRGRGINSTEGTYDRFIKDREVWSAIYQNHFINPIRPGHLTIRVRGAKDLLRLESEIKSSIKYSERGKQFTARFFGGYMLNYSHGEFEGRFFPNGTALQPSGHADFLFDQYLPGRSETLGLWSQQIYSRDGGLKTIASFPGSDSWILSAGFVFDLPLPLPLALYTDLVWYPSSESNTNIFEYSTGFSIRLISELVEIHFPIYESEGIRNNVIYDLRQGYLKRITFSIDLQRVDFIDLLSRVRE